jgi:hypothetical protein
MGLFVEIPAISAAVLAFDQLSPGAPLPAMSVVRLTSVFVGLPALVTAGGLGRLGAYESTRRTRKSALMMVTRVHAVATVLLVLLAALPHGRMPTSIFAWLMLLALGAVAGAACGALIGLVCTGSTPRQVTEMISLVTRQGMTLRQIIDTEDLGRIGAAVRQRASWMFDGFLDPAAPRPRSHHDGGDETGIVDSSAHAPSTAPTTIAKAAEGPPAAAGSVVSADAPAPQLDVADEPGPRASEPMA